MSSSLERFFRSNELMIFLCAFLVYVLTANSLWASDHTTSILELEYTMWSNHSFFLGKVGVYTPHSIDTFSYNGYYYSALAPGFAFLAYPFSSIGFMLDGHFNPWGYASLFNELFMGFGNALTAAFLYKLSRLYFKSSTSIFISLAYAFSTISWTFTSMIFQHDISALLVLVSAYCIVSYFRNGTRGQASILRPAVGGLTMGLAFSVDYVEGIIVPIFLGFILFCAWRIPAKRGAALRALVAAATAASLGFVIIGLYNLTAFGNAFSISEQLYLANGGEGILAKFSTPIYIGLEIDLLSPFRGLVFYSPFVIVGVAGLLKVLREKSNKLACGNTTKRDFWLFSFLALGTILPYSAWYDVGGGLSFGPRFLVPAIPFILLPAGFLLEVAEKKIVFRSFILYEIGVVIGGLGAIVNALGCPSTYWTYVPLFCSLPSFVVGNISTWWRDSPFWFPIALGIFAFVIFLPIPFVRKILDQSDKVLPK